MKLLWICLGGAVGTGARYLISLGMVALFGAAFPWGTLIVNIVGSALLGFIMEIGLDTQFLTAELRLALTTGVLGGFTTYSTFNWETINYLRAGAWVIAFANVLVTVVLCLVAGASGILIARRMLGM